MYKVCATKVVWMHFHFMLKIIKTFPTELDWIPIKIQQPMLCLLEKCASIPIFLQDSKKLPLHTINWSFQLKLTVQW